MDDKHSILGIKSCGTSTYIFDVVNLWFFSFALSLPLAKHEALESNSSKGGWKIHRRWQWESLLTDGDIQWIHRSTRTKRREKTKNGAHLGRCRHTRHLGWYWARNIPLWRADFSQSTHAVCVFSIIQLTVKPWGWKEKHSTKKLMLIVVLAPGAGEGNKK